MLNQLADNSKRKGLELLLRFKDTIGITHDLRLADHESRQRIDDALTAHGLTYAQYSVLSTIEEANASTNADLARLCSVTPQTMNRILQNLERDGFVHKKPHDTHGLKFDFTLTAKADRILCQAHVVVNKIETSMTRNLSPADLKRLRTILASCIENLRESKK